MAAISPLGREKSNKPIEDGWRKQVTRVIAHVDLDAFYTQVEVKNNPDELRGRPVGVVQYNPFGDLSTHAPGDNRIFNDSNGSLIAVSYEARKFGVKRNMQGHEARKLCPEIQLVQVPTAHGKADLTHYRGAGKQVTDILARLATCEKASIDECYLDITAEAKRRLEQCPATLPLPPKPDQIHVCGEGEGSAGEWYARQEQEWQEGERLLATGATVVAELRAAVQEELGFSCSAGVAHCKILAKLASGMHKPAQQTLVCKSAVPGVLQDLPIARLRQLGGKFGEEVMASLGVSTVGELAATPKSTLEGLFGEAQGQWLHELAHGIDADEVKQRTLPKSISCGKTFLGPNTLRKLEEVHRWLLELGRELEERVAIDRAENGREPKLLTIYAGGISRSGPMRRPTAEAIADDALTLLKKWTGVTPGWKINGMSVSVSNFVAAPTGKSTLSRFLKSGPRALVHPGASHRMEATHPSNVEAGHSTARGPDDDSTTSDAQNPPAQASGGEPQQRASIEGADPEVWAALPPDIQRELMLAEMGSMGSRTAQRAAANLKPGKRKPAAGRGIAKAGSIGKFFGKRN